MNTAFARRFVQGTRWLELRNSVRKIGEYPIDTHLLHALDVGGGVYGEDEEFQGIGVDAVYEGGGYLLERDVDGGWGRDLKPSPGKPPRPPGRKPAPLRASGFMLTRLRPARAGLRRGKPGFEFGCSSPGRKVAGLDSPPQRVRESHSSTKW